MKSKTLTYLSLFIAFIAFSVITGCSSTKGKIAYKKSDLSIEYYKRYKLVSNNVFTFDKKHWLSAKKAKKKGKYYKVYYLKAKKKGAIPPIVKIEVYAKRKISKRMEYNRLGLVTRIDFFTKGKLKEYYLYIYNKENETELKQGKKYNNKNLLLEVEKYMFGEKEEVEHYDSAGKKTKTELYAGAEIDMSRFYNKDGKVKREEGTYENGKYPYSLRYFYDKNSKLIKIEDYRRNKLNSIYYYNSDGQTTKEEHYRNGKLIRTVNFGKK